MHECHNFLLETCLTADSKLEGLKNVNATVGLLYKLDFVIHFVKSMLKLTQKNFLLLLLHSVDMIILVKTLLFQ